MSEVPDTVGALAMSYIDRTLRSGKDVTIPSLDIVIKFDETLQRAQRAEAQLAAATAERDALRADVERFGADQWRRGNAGKDPQEFEEWRREQA